MKKGKQILYNTEARKKIKDGIIKACDIMSISIGPKGRNVIVRDYNKPTNGQSQEIIEGGNIIKYIDSKDSFEKIGIQLVQEVANSMQEVGDGVSTAMVLISAILKEGIKLIEAGVNPIEFNKGLEAAKNVAIQYLKENSISVKDDFNKIQAVATISSGDEDLGFLIAQAFEQSKGDGTIQVQKGTSRDTYIEKQEGMIIEKGWGSIKNGDEFITNKDKRIIEFENPYLIFSNDQIGDIHQIADILQKAHAEGVPVIFFAKTIDGSALKGLILNKNKVNLKAACIQIPYGDAGKSLMEDLATLTDGVIFDTQLDFTFNKAVYPESFGQCKQIIIEKDKTTIIGGAGSQEAIQERIEILKYQKETLSNLYDQDKVQHRIAALADGLTTIVVGANTATEYAEKKSSVDNALIATNAAIKNGYVCGGGLAYIQASNAILYSDLYEKGDTKYFTLGVDTLKKALFQPTIKLCNNGGFEGIAIAEHLKEEKNFNIGFNVITGQYEDFFEANIIDPTEILILALEKAVSVVKTILTSECVIADPNKKEGKEK